MKSYTCTCLKEPVRVVPVEDVLKMVEWLKQKRLGSKEQQAIMLPSGKKVIAFYEDDFDEAFEDVKE